jgi:hypothetical protein
MRDDCEGVNLLRVRHWENARLKTKSSVVGLVENKMGLVTQQRSSLDDKEQIHCYIVCLFSISVQDKL